MGVGADIAAGSQDINGNWALLVIIIKNKIREDKNIWYIIDISNKNILEKINKKISPILLLNIVIKELFIESQFL